MSRNVGRARPAGRARRVLVIGAGVIGVTTAWQLAEEGHKVTVLDKEGDIAAGTSHENGGQLSWSHAVPMAAPGMLRFLLANVWRRSSPVSLAPWVVLGQPGWLLRSLAECAPHRHADNRRRMAALARYSLACLDDLSGRTGIDYARRSGGMLQVFRTPKALARHRAGLAAMGKAGLDVALAETPDDIRQHEPAFGEAADGLAGALMFRGQASGDCRAFTRALAALGAARGIEFRTGSRVRSLVTDKGRVCGVKTASGDRIEAELVVLCTGQDEGGLLRGLRRQPLAPVRGRSLTLRLADPAPAPACSIIDEDSRLSIARLGDTLRLAGYADLVGRSSRWRPGQTDALRTALGALLPDLAARATEQSRWTGFRPATPDGVPMIGATEREGLWLNLGHGGYGWTMAAGSARMLADQIASRDPALPACEYAPARHPNQRRK